MSVPPELWLFTGMMAVLGAVYFGVKLVQSVLRYTVLAGICALLALFAAHNLQVIPNQLPAPVQTLVELDQLNPVVDLQNADIKELFDRLDL